MATIDQIIANLIGTIITRWVTIVVTFAATLVSVYITNRYVSSAREERLEQAKNNLLDILENNIINRKEISIDKLDNLIKAVERDQSVPLSNNISKTSILQDLELRFEKSRHLDPEQKEKYTDKIENHIDEIKEAGRTTPISKERKELFNEIRNSISEGDPDQALKELSSLEDNVSQLEKQSSPSSPFVSFSDPASTTIMLILVVIMYYYLFSTLITDISFPDLAPTTFIVFLILLYSLAGYLLVKTEVGRSVIRSLITKF